MKILGMDATFGKLRRESLKLNSGLNVIFGENESGKSTWCGFIRAMLYGINTREQSKTGFLADKERYMPHSGEGMHGRMEVEWQGKNLVIERNPGKGNIFTSPAVTDSKTGLAVSMDVPGEDMLGIKKEVFDRSAFVGQSFLRVDTDKSGELEKRIVSLAGSGREEYSFSAAEQRLKSWKNKRRYHSRGIAPELECKIADIKSTLNSLHGEAVALTVKQSKILELKTIRESYEKQAETWRNLRAWEKMNLSLDAENELKEAENNLSEITRLSSYGDFMPDDIYCENLQKLYQQYINDEKNYAISIENVRKAEKELAEEKEKLNLMGNAALRENPDIQGDIKEAEAIEESIKKISFAKPAIISTVIAALLGAGALFALKTASMFSDTVQLIAVMCILLTGIATGLIFGVGGRKKSVKLKARLEEILVSYSVDKSQDIESKVQTCSLQKAKVEEALTAAALAQNNMDRMSIARDESRRDIQQALNALSADATFEDAPHFIEEMRARIAKVRQAQIKLETARVRFETVKKGHNLDLFLKSGDINAPGSERPEYSEEELGTKLEEVNAALRELELDCSAISARINHVGNQGDLQEALRCARIELEEVETDTRAIEYAIEELKNANGEIQHRFAPALEKKTAEIFEELTGGRFKIVEILNSQMELSVREESAAESQQVIQLSAGTADELYLSMRLALSDMLIEDEDIPLVLDDALVNFDDVRMAKTMDYLHRISEKRQVILFSCQKREAEYAKAFADVKIQSI